MKVFRSTKYRNRKIKTPDGEFDSVREHSRWVELQILEKAGLISGLKRQVKFELIPSQKEGKKTVERSVSYVADFVYRENGKTVVEDAKGVRTPEYIIKRKLMLWVHKIKVVEI